MKNLFIALLFVTSYAHAWGPTGHRVVGEIAEKHLSPNTLAKVRGILNGQSLARVSTWPDEIKSEPAKYSETFNWHYTDWKEDQEEHDHDHNSGKLIPALEEQIATLKDESKTQAQKEFAIKFLVHLIGDLHMPLHVGNGLDEGGNWCKVYYFNQLTNLHRLWDQDMIQGSLLSFTELSEFVQQTYSYKTVEYKKGSIMDWAIESKNLRNQIYPAEVIPGMNYCAKPASDTPANLPRLGYEYSYRFMPVVEERLYQGGVRLAKVLDSIFNP